MRDFNSQRTLHWSFLASVRNATFDFNSSECSSDYTLTANWGLSALNYTVTNRNGGNGMFCCVFIAFLWPAKRKCKHSCLMMEKINPQTHWYQSHTVEFELRWLDAASTKSANGCWDWDGDCKGHISVEEEMLTCADAAECDCELLHWSVCVCVSSCNDIFVRTILSLDPTGWGHFEQSTLFQRAVWGLGLGLRVRVRHLVWRVMVRVSWGMYYVNECAH